MDNFEWAYGWWPKFGLVEVDRKNNMKRTPRPSAVWFAEYLLELQGKEAPRKKLQEAVQLNNLPRESVAKPIARPQKPAHGLAKAPIAAVAASGQGVGVGAKPSVAHHSMMRRRAPHAQAPTQSPSASSVGKAMSPQQADVGAPRRRSAAVERISNTRSKLNLNRFRGKIQ